MGYLIIRGLNEQQWKEDTALRLVDDDALVVGNPATRGSGGGLLPNPFG